MCLLAVSTFQPPFTPLLSRMRGFFLQFKIDQKKNFFRMRGWKFLEKYFNLFEWLPIGKYEIFICRSSYSFILEYFKNSREIEIFAGGFRMLVEIDMYYQVLKELDNNIILRKLHVKNNL